MGVDVVLSSVQSENQLQETPAFSSERWGFCVFLSQMHEANVLELISSSWAEFSSVLHDKRDTVGQTKEQSLQDSCVREIVNF